jgi:hypothetical protein
VRIPEAVKEEIRARADIVAIVGRYVDLKRRGRNWVGRCPFHTDGKPSFEVMPDKRIFYCFPCGEGGDVFKFVQKVQGVEFLDAVRWLGNEYGIATDGRALAVARQLPPPPPKPEPPPPPDVTPFWEACQPAPANHPFLVSRRYTPNPELVRFTPEYLDPWPDWWPGWCRRPWRLVTRGWDVQGRAVNVHGRAVEPLAPDQTGNTRWGKGIPSGGLHFSNLRPVADLVVIAEGLTDWLAGCMMFPSVAVRGATNGGFASFADLDIPNEVRVVSVTDEDDTGDRYHAEIVAALPGREILRAHPDRLRPSPGEKRYDLSDAWRDGRTAHDLLATCTRAAGPATRRRWHDFFPGGIGGCGCLDCTSRQKKAS